MLIFYSSLFEVVTIAPTRPVVCSANISWFLVILVCCYVRE